MFTDTRRIAAKPSKRQIKQWDRTIEAIYYRHCAGVQIRVLDMRAIYDSGRAVARAGGNLEAITAAVLATVAALRTN